MSEEGVSGGRGYRSLDEVNTTPTGRGGEFGSHRRVEGVLVPVWDFHRPPGRCETGLGCSLGEEDSHKGVETRKGSGG